MDIEFIFEGQRYSVGKGAENHNYIVLPDNRILHTTEGWRESCPPMPISLTIAPIFALGATAEETARLYNSALARRV